MTVEDLPRQMMTASTCYKFSTNRWDVYMGNCHALNIRSRWANFSTDGRAVALCLIGLGPLINAHREEDG
uniref:Uncharacterized protein n=1 Tax=Haemonchus contortus TaxID=6289 RepID=A0A7I4YC61_HAECO